MARLFAFLANRPDVGAKVLEAEASLIDHPAHGEPLGWGAGFYQGGEVLLRRRPVDERGVLPLAASLADVRTTALLGHVRRASVGTLRTENTHPFRHRQWLFAHTGTVSGFSSMYERLVESIPQFLRRNVRGETDSELLFHLFLSFLHDAGKLERQVVDPSDVRAALRSCLSLVDRLSAEEGAEPAGGNIMVTDGEQVVAVHDGGNMAYRTYQGRDDFDALLAEDGLRRTRVPDINTAVLHLVIAGYSGESARFTNLPDRSILTFTRASAPLVEPL